MSLETVQRTFEKLGREDPLYAVLTDHSRRHNKWDPDEFFATGVTEIQQVVGYLGERGLPTGRLRGLDFGCGVGRLTQALAAHFDQMVGVDIADSMIAQARVYNRAGERVQYLVNTKDDLTLLDSNSFDFVYSNITLQHIPPASSAKYIAEFIRVLRPGGVALFQVPAGPLRYRPGTFSALMYDIKRRWLRRAWKLIRGRAPYEMHYLPLAQVKEIVAASGAHPIDILDVGGGRRAGRGMNYRYCIQKGGTTQTAADSPRG